MTRALLLTGPLALLAGCAGSAGPCNPTAAPVFPAPTDECGAAEFARYAGAQATAEVRAAIAVRLGDRRVRYIAPGDAVTQDYRIDRLNVELGEDGRIARLRCG
jgi:hypothetical protein